MRKITRTVIVNKPVQVEQVVGASIDLTVEELAFLAVVLAKIGGSPDDSLRKYATSISDKLAEGNIYFGNIDSDYSVSDFIREDHLGYKRGITFEEDSLNHPGFVGFVNHIKENVR